MKNNIKKVLREGLIPVSKNILNVEVSRPSQVLIIMRGIPGSGKSTKAKSLVGQGKIHSTDDVIEAGGDYREFFAKMIASGDFSPLSKAHSQNLKDAIESMKAGITPIIVDNTNIKHNEPKDYVKAALEMGFADNNIKFVDVGTAGLTAEQLAARNTHGVPVEKIKQMMDSHAGQGEMTLNKVLESKDFYKQSNVLYSAVVLDKASYNKLLDRFALEMPEGWKTYAHHMTITMGELKDKTDIGKEVILKVTKVGLSDMAMAVQVEGYTSKNAIPHVTLAVNPEGGKPKDSNSIQNWQDIKPFFIGGFVNEITK
jgi:predicted kinase